MEIVIEDVSREELQAALTTFYAKLEASQKDLPVEFAEVLYANIWDLV